MGQDLNATLDFTKLILNYTTDSGFSHALQLFREASQRVPAYKDFLNQHNIDPRDIHTAKDFERVPCMTKENYLKKYSFKDLHWDGTTSEARVISMSSGSSGQPFFWSRGVHSTRQASQLHASLFNNSFNTFEKETLVIVAFAMGTWIAGTYTYSALLDLAETGHKITIITPGINKQENIRILQQLAPEFEQVILMGYPPSVKDILDSAREEGVALDTINLRLVFAGESYSERWRDYILSLIGAHNDLNATASIYGTADAGCLGYESPLSIYIRRLADQNDNLFSNIFPKSEALPTLVHYDPTLRYFESVDGSLVFTVRNSLPLIRYNILDRGRIITWHSMLDALHLNNITIPTELRALAPHPYIALYGRDDVATTFYALNIYPENIKYGLEMPKLQSAITGKFVIKTDYEAETQDQSLHLFVELKKDILPSAILQERIGKYVLSSLLEKNSEYAKLYQEMKQSAVPHIHLMQNGSAQFEIKVKHRWVSRV